MLCALLAGCLVLRLSAKATAAVSIKRSEHLTLDGTKLYLLTRGADRERTRVALATWRSGRG